MVQEHKPRHLTVWQWREARYDTRLAIARMFNIRNSGVVKVIHGHGLVDDGFTFEDLDVITVKALQEKIPGSEQVSDIFTLFKELIIRIEHPHFDVPVLVENNTHDTSTTTDADKGGTGEAEKGTDSSEGEAPRVITGQPENIDSGNVTATDVQSNQSTPADSAREADGEHSGADQTIKRGRGRPRSISQAN